MQPMLCRVEAYLDSVVVRVSVGHRPGVGRRPDRHAVAVLWRPHAETRVMLLERRIPIIPMTYHGQDYILI